MRFCRFVPLGYEWESDGRNSVFRRPRRFRMDFPQCYVRIPPQSRNHCLQYNPHPAAAVAKITASSPWPLSAPSGIEPFPERMGGLARSAVCFILLPPKPRLPMRKQVILIQVELRPNGYRSVSSYHRIHHCSTWIFGRRQENKAFRSVRRWGTIMHL